MRVYGYSALERAGRCGNQLWQVAATINHSLHDPGSRASIKPDWEYRLYLSLPEALYRPPQSGEEIVDVARLEGGPYWQWLGAIDRVASGLRRLYRPSQMAQERFLERHGVLLVQGGHQTALHVRRTDYLDNPDRFPQLTPHYYQSALKQIRQEVGETRVLVFSDDVAWCRDNQAEWFGEGEFVFIEGHVRPIPPEQRVGEPADIYDLWLMAHCDAHVIANSSFSWWGAFLSHQERVFYPDRWYGPDAQHVDRMWEAFPPSWRQLPC